MLLACQKFIVAGGAFLLSCLAVQILTGCNAHILYGDLTELHFKVSAPLIFRNHTVVS